MSDENTGLTSPYSLADKLITRGPINSKEPFRKDEDGFEVPNRIFDKEGSAESELDIEKANALYETLHNLMDHPIDSKDFTSRMPIEELLFPDTEESSKEEAKVSSGSKRNQAQHPEEKEKPSVTSSSLYPDKTYGSSTVETVASLAEHTKEELKAAVQEEKQKQLESVNDPSLLYQRFDDTFTKLFEELENNDVLSSGQKSALLMKCAMLSKNILKERFDVTI